MTALIWLSLPEPGLNENLRLQIFVISTFSSTSWWTSRTTVMHSLFSGSVMSLSSETTRKLLARWTLCRLKSLSNHLTRRCSTRCHTWVGEKLLPSDFFSQKSWHLQASTLLCYISLSGYRNLPASPPNRPHLPERYTDASNKPSTPENSSLIH